MMLEGLSRSRGQELEEQIERHIFERTWGRIRRLQVDVSEERVSVRGNTSTYYVMQLAVQAVLDVLGPSCGVRVDVALEVGCSDRGACCP